MELVGRDRNELTHQPANQQNKPFLKSDYFQVENEKKRDVRVSPTSKDKTLKLRSE